MTSVERIRQYAKLQPEAEEHVNEYPLPKDWPTKGVIRFDHVTLNYIEGHQPAINDISFNIRSKEKVIFPIVPNSKYAQVLRF